MSAFDIPPPSEEMTPQQRIDDLKADLDWLYARIDAINARISAILGPRERRVSRENLLRQHEWARQRRPLKVEANALESRIRGLVRATAPPQHGGSRSRARSRGKKTRRR